MTYPPFHTGPGQIVQDRANWTEYGIFMRVKQQNRRSSDKVALWGIKVMNDVVMLRPVSGDLTVFDPTETIANLAQLDGDIVKWRRLKDWPKLEDAVDAKIAEQAAFVANWDTTVRAAHRPGTNSQAGLFSKRQAEEAWGFSQQTVSRWRTWLAETPVYRSRLILGAHRLAGLIPEDNHRAMGTGENEWFTPEQYIAAARSVMGAIDLDPASHDDAQDIVQATKYYTKAEDGLAPDWHGRVWLNPPYARDDIRPFVEKLVDERNAGRVTEAIMLTHNYTDTAWFQLAARRAALICFTLGRIKFVGLDGKESNPTQGQAFFYFGDNVQDFRRVFSYGFLVWPG
jgi:phage N-6-adenine-methyltransferase